MDTLVKVYDLKTNSSCHLVFGSAREAFESAFFKELLFSAGDIFCIKIYDRRLSGSTKWGLYVLEAKEDFSTISVIPNVIPGARVLMRALGKQKVEEALAWIFDLRASVDPSTLSPAVFIKQHGIINTSFIPRVG